MVRVRTHPFARDAHGKQSSVAVRADVEYKQRQRRQSKDRCHERMTNTDEMSGLESERVRMAASYPRNMDGTATARGAVYGSRRPVFSLLMDRGRSV